MGNATSVLVTGGCLLLLSGAAAGQTVVHFSDGTGLSAVARFELKNARTTLVVSLRNTSTGLPATFQGEDQILTGLSFDLGAPGVSAGDPSIVSGTVRTGPTTVSLDFDVVSVGGDEDVSGEFGYGNAGSGSLLPNLVSALDVQALGFGGANLDGPVELAGPAAGLVPAAGPLASLGGEGALQGEVVIELNLDAPLTGLGFLGDHGALVEFGSGRASVTADCDHDARSLAVVDMGGLNAPNSLNVKRGSRPTIGNPNFQVQVDDPADACGITPGAQTQVFFSPDTASILWPGFGCRPGGLGEIMIDIGLPLTISGLVPWPGPGMPACHSFAIPADPTLCRVVCRGQAVFIDGRPPMVRFVLTNRLDIVFGL